MAVTSDRCLWPEERGHAPSKLTFSNGARLTIITNDADFQDEGSDEAAARFRYLLRSSKFHHVFYMCPHGREYFAEERQAQKERRTNDPAKILDPRGRNMCIAKGKGTASLWGDYLHCAASFVAGAGGQHRECR